MAFKSKRTDLPLPKISFQPVIKDESQDKPLSNTFDRLETDGTLSTIRNRINQA